MSAGRRLFSASVAALLFRLGGAIIMLAVQLIIVRELGAQNLGLYVLLLAVCNLICAVLPLGFQTIASYFVADYASHANGIAMRRFMLQAYGQTIGVAAIVYGLGQVFAANLSNDVALGWSQLTFAGLGLALIQLGAANLIALKRPMIGSIADAFVRPCLTVCALLLALQFAPHQRTIYVMFNILAIGFISVGIIYFVFASMSAQSVAKPADGHVVAQKTWWYYAAPWSLIALASDYFFDISLLLLAAFLGFEDLAVFGIAARLVGIAAFGTSAAYGFSLPEFFEATAPGEERRFLAHVQTANRVAISVGMLIFASAIFIAPSILRLLGPDFERSAIPFAILCLIPLVRSFFGPTALLLSLRGRPYAALPPVLIGFVVLVLATLVLVPNYGLNGAAVSAVLSSAAWSASLWFIARQATGLNVSILARAPQA